MNETIRFKIFRDSKRRPTVTLCEIKVNGDTGSGWAIRSLGDNPVEKVGKIKAYGRAKKALFQRKNTLPIIRPAAFLAIEAANVHFSVKDFNGFKSVYQGG